MAICPNCKTPIPDTAKFCPRCGSPAPSRPRPTAPATAPKGVNTPLVPIVVLAAIIVVALVIANPLGCGWAPAEAGTPVTPQTSTTTETPAPKNYEEYLRYTGTYEELCNEIRNDLLSVASLSAGAILNYEVGVSGNQITVVAYLNQSSSETSLLGGLLNTLFANLVSEAFGGYEQISNNILVCEEESDIDGITLHYEMRYSDGAILGTMDFDNTGRIQ